MTPTDIDALLRETEATLLSLSPTTTEEIQELEDDLESLVVFQQECERRLDDLTGEREVVREDPDGETVDGMAQDEERAGVEERRGGPEENSQGRSKKGSKDEVRETEEDTGGRKEGEAQGKENQGEGETNGKADIKEDMEEEEKKEEEEEEEEMKLAQRSLLEAANDLTELRPQSSEGRSVRPKSKLGPRKSSDSQKINSPASDPFGNGQPVTEKPRPLLSPKNSPIFTMSNLQQELTYFLDMSFQSPKKAENYFTFPEVPNNTPATSSKATTPTASDVTTTPTTTTPTADDTLTRPISPTTATTTNTNAFSPPTSPLHHPHKTPEAMSSFSSTTTINTINTTPPFTPPPLSSTSTTSCAFIYPSSPRASIPASPRSEKGFFQHDQPQQHQEQHQQHKKPRHRSFSSLVEDIKSKGWRNSFRITNKKRRLIISEPQDFRQLKATTSIRPDMDTFMPDAINLRRTGNGTTEVWDLGLVSKANTVSASPLGLRNKQARPQPV